MEDTDKSKASWLWYGAEILTVFFALAILTGRVYAQSYWGVFGLPPEIISTNLVDYAIMSPNAALACVIIAISTVVMIALIRRKPPYFKSGSNLWVIYFAGGVAFLGGLFVICIIPRVDLSAWTPGTAGLALGLGYLSYLGGFVVFLQAGLMLREEERPKKEIVSPKKSRGVLFALAQIFIVVGFVGIAASSIWSIVGTAKEFGTNEAKFMCHTRPWATVQLDSQKGFEDLTLASSSGSVTLKPVKIIVEANGFLYVTPDFIQSQDKLSVRVVPISRVQAIQYDVVLPPTKQ